MSRHPCQTDQQLRAFHAGTASEAELDGTAAHLRGCPACVARLDRMAVRDDPVLAGLRGVAQTPPSNPDDEAYLRAVRSVAGSAPGDLPPPAVGPGTTLGEYRLAERLGEGGMGA